MSAGKRHVETREERLVRIRAEVKTWPRLTPERKAELRRLLMPSSQRIRAQILAEQAEASARDTTHTEIRD